MKKIILLSMLLSATSLFAQTDFTSCITNPSFENNGASGWTKQGMSPQGNDVFTLKQGSTYMEKWTGRGGQVGSCFLKQKVTGLAPGNYKMTVAAQNIQEDTPTTAQTGAWIYVDNAKTTVTICANYEVEFNYVSGYILIGFEAQDATGNYICVDNFRLTKVGDDLSAELAASISSTTSFYNSATGTGKERIKDAIVKAEVVAAYSSATAQQQADAIIAMEEAIDAYKRANASSTNPYDLTSLIENPSFETGDLEGWTSQSMGIQGNDAFKYKVGNYYVEKWTGRGGQVGDGFVSQTLTEMAPGRYRLKAASQNIQEDYPTRAQSGAWLFANTSKQTVTTGKDYSFEFVLTSDQLTFGFKAEGATGNYLCIDNFRLEYIGDSEDDVRAAFAQLIQDAEALVVNRMNTTTQQNLQQAIDAAKPLQTGALNELAVASRILEAAYQEGQISAAAFAKLNTAITNAQNELNSSSAGNKADYQAAIDAASNVYNATSTTNEQALAAIDALDVAAFAFKIANGTGTVPTVKTDSRYIKGSRWAFGRSTVSGSNILETGFCWSENPDPKVTDNRTTKYLNQQGKIYWLEDLKPATMYYMRAYAITKTYAVGYGDVIKFSTLPASSIGHWYNGGDDDAANDRINYAINVSMDYYWGNASSIHDFGITVNYSPGTPTADCSYGGWMRVGTSSSYQQPGTIMHEALHGIGVGTHDMWWGSALRPSNIWEGDQVTSAIRFWDNNTDGVLYGDNMHMWPYGCNGAQEDSHSDNLYVMMGILAQALNEDGLPAPGTNYALPYYSFRHDDDVKYYIKNEDETRGLNSSYLVETSSHQLQWKEMSAEDAANDDAAAWYITFTPSNQYYQLRNAKTGYYITYSSSSFKTARHTTPTSADNIHLMRGRVDVKASDASPAYRGYYFIHPEGSGNPPTLVANTSNRTAAQSLDLAKSATTQRWLILTIDEAQAFENGHESISKQALDDLIALVRQLLEVPHIELEEGADETLTTRLDNIVAQEDAAHSESELNALMSQTRQAGKEFVAVSYATNPDNPFDITFLLANPHFTTYPTEGWTTTANFNYSDGIVEYFETTFDHYQLLESMPKGTYQLRVQAFQRPGAIASVYSDYNAGNDNISADFYIAATHQNVKNICAETSSTKLTNDDVAVATRKYVPNTRAGAAAYFNKQYYDNVLTRQHPQKSRIKLGIRGTASSSAYWTAFDNFRLYFIGDEEIATGIKDVDMFETEELNEETKIYDLSGRRFDSLKGLQKGIYIINGKKILVK